MSKFKRTIHEKRTIVGNDGNLSISSLQQERSHSNAQMLEVSKFKPLQELSNQAMEDILKAREEELDQNAQEQEQGNNAEIKVENQENQVKHPTESEPESVKEKKRIKLNDALYHLGIDVSPETDQEETEFRD